MADDPKLAKKCRLFCDLDGVLCDFAGGVQELCGKVPEDMREKDMWNRIKNEDNFFAELKWTLDGQQLWQGLLTLCADHPDLFAAPKVLTGLPRGDAGTVAKKQKLAWCQKNLGVRAKDVLCVQTAQKHHYSGPACVLIDDREGLSSLWTAKGGTFIHHTSASTSIAQLQSLVSALQTGLAPGPAPSSQSRVLLSLKAASGPKKDQTVPFLLENGKWDSLLLAAKAKLRIQPSFIYACLLPGMPLITSAAEVLACGSTVLLVSATALETDHSKSFQASSLAQDEPVQEETKHEGSKTEAEVEGKGEAANGETEGKTELEVAIVKEFASLDDIVSALKGSRMVILVGVPGSGKSTLCKQIEATRVSQDDLGSRDKCEKAVREALAQGESVVVDRCNHTRSQRSTWTGIAREKGLTCDMIRFVWLDLRPALCIERARLRSEHPTLSGLDAPRVISRFAAELEPPSPSEFGQVLVYRPVEAEDVFAQSSWHESAAAAAAAAAATPLLTPSTMTTFMSPLQELLHTLGIARFADVQKLLEGPTMRVNVKTMDSLYLPMYSDFTRFRSDSALETRAVNHCRGPIYEKGSNRLVAWAFDKFWEHDHKLALTSQIDWSTAVGLEKMDGCIVKVFVFNGEWRLSSNSCIDALHAPVYGTTSTIMGLFQEAAAALSFDYSRLNTQRMYVFELCHPKSRIVVYHDAPVLYHLLTRDLDGKEIPLEEDEDLGIPRPRVIFPKGQCTLPVCLDYCARLCTQEEGLVVVDGNGRRIKIKGRDWLAVHSFPGRFDTMWFHAVSILLRLPTSTPSLSSSACPLCNSFPPCSCSLPTSLSSLSLSSSSSSSLPFENPASSSPLPSSVNANSADNEQEEEEAEEEAEEAEEEEEEEEEAEGEEKEEEEDTRQEVKEREEKVSISDLASSQSPSAVIHLSSPLSPASPISSPSSSSSSSSSSSTPTTTATTSSLPLAPFPWEGWRKCAETVPGLLPVASWILEEMTVMISELCQLVSALISEPKGGKRSKSVAQELKCWVEEEVQVLVQLVTSLPERDNITLHHLWAVAMTPSLSAPPLLRKMLERRVSDLCNSKKGKAVLKRLKR